MAAGVSDFQILRSRVAIYSSVLLFALLSAPLLLLTLIFGVFAWTDFRSAGDDVRFDLILGLIVVMTLGSILGVSLAWWFSKLWANCLRYWLDGTTLRVDSGVLFLKRSAIPLDRVTDITLVQGPLMAACGIWSVCIQTAGTGVERPEEILYGLETPERVRDLLIATRDAAVIRNPAQS